jgi:hypothetical protein
LRKILLEESEPNTDLPFTLEKSGISLNPAYGTLIDAP